MGHQHNNRNPKIEWSVVKQTVQYGFFLVVCFWLVYQVHHSLSVHRDTECDFAESRVREERLVKVLGRKGGASMSHYTEDLELYGADLIREADRIKKGSDNEYDQSNTSNTEGLDQEESSEHNGEPERDWEILGETSSAEGQNRVKGVSIGGNRENDQRNESDQVNQIEGIEFTNKTLDNNAISSEEDRGVMHILEKLSSEDEEESNNEESQDTDKESEMRVSAVILKKDESLGVFRYNDENGIPEHESAPSRRSDLQYESMINANSSNAGNQNMKLEQCTLLCLQNSSEQTRSEDVEVEEVNEEMPMKMEVMTSRQGSMRELLLTER